VVDEFPDWWRGERAPEAYDGPRPVLTGPMLDLDLDQLPENAIGLREIRFFRARARGLELSLTDASLHVRWSQFDGCRFHQRVRPVCNAAGYAAQGSFGSSPSIYRSCVFERIRFKLMGGFSMGRARFEDCTFVNCRWEGAFGHQADLVDCRFIGRMNGCVWFGEDRRDPQRVRVNDIRGNDFTETVFTDNVGWRHDFPVDRQHFPAGYSLTSRF
jgi:hypothetical protein